METELGTVVAPSGALLIVDPGYLDMWSHGRAPVMPDGVLPERTTLAANACIDAALFGVDADEIGRQLGQQWNPRFIYDIPRELAAELAARVTEIGTRRHLDARLEILAERVPHRVRADHALSVGACAGEVQFHGVWAGVVAGVPRRELRVVGEAMPGDGPDAGRLRRVRIAVREGRVARSERFGYAMVDLARLLIIDLDAVASWQHTELLDGLADFAFWGADAHIVAGRLKAAELGDRVFGWRDLPVDDAVDRGTAVEQLRDHERLKLATDFRPHTHDYQLMEQVRSSATESGVVRLGDALACGFMTTWGDGLFELHRDVDERGQLLQLRIELGIEERQRLMRAMELRWSKSALVSRKVADEGLAVRFMYRAAPHRDADSGWRMFSGLESDAYSEDAKNIAIVPLTRFSEIDKRVDALLDEPVGAVFERAQADADFVRITDWAPQDE
ncbi:MAG: DUF2185 domain-containing protein [Deltaproteobacteria bacterium]|nr:DUF2185 domain-containing protein [Deltaproteobacteria bacterium]